MKNGFVTTGIVRPIVRVLAVTSDRAIVLCVYPVCSIACSTASRVCSRTTRVLLITWETVETETPAALATSAIVTTLIS